MAVLRRLRTQRPDLPVVMVTDHGTIERAVEATRLGALDFVEKPFVRVNCAAIANDLIEAEPFGAVKGAYTSSVAAREGRFGAADELGVKRTRLHKRISALGLSGD